MVDNPIKFISYIAIAVIVLTLIVMGFRGSKEKETQNTDSSGATTTVTTSGTSGKVTAPKPKTTPPQGGTTGPVTYDAVVNYTDSGFIPGTLEVKAGTSVRFINKSSGTMWVSSVSTPGVPLYTDFSQSKSVGKNGFFDFNFSKQGAWLYQNLNDKTKTGIVIVK